ncbi:putative venom phosphodiesterase 2, partial [Apostichopus japonicus]
NSSPNGIEGGKTDPKQKADRKLMFIIILLVDLVVALGVGIGVGYAIGNSETDTFTEPGEPTSQAPPTYEHWVDRPCMTEPSCPADVSKPPLIIVSLDGFRSDFMDRELTPNLDKLRNCGINAPHMVPSFPTLTFPNHYTQVTGLYPESHGIVGNNMYDSDLGVFSLSSSNKLKSEWWGGEPIWNTAKKHGLRTATYFWVGSDVEIQEMRPDYWFLYADAEYFSRVDVLVALLSQPEGLRPDLLTLYYDEPDHTGHEPGPNSPEEDEQIKRMDGIIGYLMDGLMRIGFHDCIDVIVMADHGMANRTCDQLYVLDDYIEEDDYYIRSTCGTMLRLDPKSSAGISEAKDVVDALKCTHPVATPYVKTDIPKRWHYINNIRIEDILITVPAGWTASASPSTWCDGGTHGYDNLGKLMKALFIAQGPSFKSGLTIEPFHNIELYELMCEILEITPAPNNGTRGALHHLLKNVRFPPEPTPPTIPSTIVACDYPADDTAYNKRIEDDTSGCGCINIPADDLKAFDSRLETVANNEENHAPFGLPIVMLSDEVCQLRQENYSQVTVTEWRTTIPTYTIEKDQITTLSGEKEDCLSRPDVRLPADVSTHDCNFLDSNLTGFMENLTTGYLYPPILGQSEDEMMDALINSNAVMQFKGFRTDMWDGFLFQQVARWADSSNGINVISGPIYDLDADGLADGAEIQENDTLLLPTHFFMVVSRCSGDQVISASCSDVETISFVLPNMDGIYTCQTSADYVEHHRASIRDVELLTGLSFYPDVNLNSYEQIYLRSKIHEKGDIWTDWPLTTN